MQLPEFASRDEPWVVPAKSSRHPRLVIMERDLVNVNGSCHLCVSSPLDVWSMFLTVSSVSRHYLLYI